MNTRWNRAAILAALAAAAIPAVTQAGGPSGFCVLMLGAAPPPVGNGMIEVAGNPLVAALFPEAKTTHLNWFHAFFPIGIVGKLRPRSRAARRK